MPLSTEFVAPNSTNNVWWHKQSMFYAFSVLVPLLVVFGMIGNITSLLVFLYSKLRKHSFNWYLIALNINDCVCLVAIFMRWVHYLGNYSLPGFCQTYMFILYAGMGNSAWLVMSLTIERYLAICHALFHKRISSVRNVRIACVFLAVLAVLSHLYIPLAMSTNDSALVLKCYIEKGGHNVFLVISHMRNVFTLFLPLIAIMLFNSLTAIHSWKEAKTRKALAPSSRLDRSPIRKMSHLFLIVSIAFLIQNLPITVVYRIIHHRGDVDFSANLYFAERITTLLFFTSFSFNFVLYCASGTTFTRELQKKIHNRRWFSFDAARDLSLRRVSTATSISFKFEPARKKSQATVPEQSSHIFVI